MQGYLGEFPVDIEKHDVFSKYTSVDWAMLFIEMYGGIDGAHHKNWVLDQVSRVLKGTPVIVTLAKWGNGECEYRHTLGEPSKAYLDWRELMLDRDENGEPQYGYEEGTPP